MVTLAIAVNSTEDEWALSGPLPAGTEYIQVDDELVEVITPDVLAGQRAPSENIAQVRRNTAGTVASHSQGATLTALTAAPLGGGAAPTLAEVLAAGNDTNGIAITGSIVTSGAIAVGSGTAAATSTADSDSGDTWATSIASTETGTGNANARSTANSFSGTANVGTSANSDSGNAYADSSAYSESGNARAVADAYSASGIPESGFRSTRDSVVLSVVASVDNSAVRHLKISGLPTSNPNVVGDVWNDAGTLKISAG